MSKANPMCIKNYSYKVEFALRGAGHIHGVMWMDWENFSALNTDFDTDCDTDINSDLKISPTKMVESALDKIRKEEMLTPKEKDCVAKFADLFITCTLKDPNTKAIVEEVQMHHHTHSCRKYNCEKCRFYYPRFPSLRTLVSVPVHKNEGNLEVKAKRMDDAKALLKKVSMVLEDDARMDILNKIGKKEIDEYIYLQETIIFLENLIKHGNKDKSKIVTITEKLKNHVNKYTSYKEVSLNTSKKHLKTMLEEMKPSLTKMKGEI